MKELIEKLKSAEQNAYGMFEIDEDTICALVDVLESSVCIQDAWLAAGGNPGIKASKDELLSALCIMDEAIE